jgi:hypothetical protein
MLIPAMLWKALVGAADIAVVVLDEVGRGVFIGATRAVAMLLMVDPVCIFISLFTA